MKERGLAWVLFVALGVGAGGCKNKCDVAADDIEKKYLECSIETKESGDPPPPCTEERGAQQECVSKCLVDASCETLKGADPDGAAEYAECLEDC